MKNTLLFLFLLSTTLAWGQGERFYIRRGNNALDKGKFNVAEVDYLRALAIDTASYEATFNLGNALYKAKRHEDAVRYYQKVASDSLNVENFAAANYNLGNALVKGRKLEEAIAAYKKSLIANPTDTLAKQNLAYAQELLKKDNEGDGNDNQDNKNQDSSDDKNQQQNNDNKQNKDQNKDQNQDQNKDNQDNQNNQNQDQNNGDENGENQDKNGENQEPNSNQNQESPSSLKEREAEQMLEAIQASEDKTQEKLNDKKGVAVSGRGIKNW